MCAAQLTVTTREVVTVSIRFEIKCRMPQNVASDSSQERNK